MSNFLQLAYEANETYIKIVKRMLLLSFDAEYYRLYRLSNKSRIRFFRRLKRALSDV